VIDIDNRPSTLYPVYAWGHQECDQSQFIALGAPPLEGPSQHPTQCRRKALPASNAVPEGGLFAYCLKHLPGGSQYVAY